ncbi:MAG: cation:dicarboxylase symporter family transporter [Peptostreptococcaceae bacterium]|nr:cation:dicarboxylase symporter family transporter [Peptostreptococcaceae bacterium]
MKTQTSKNNANSLAIKMAIALILGLIAGTSFIFLRENLISNGNSDTWTLINNLLFQDISKPEANKAIGIFYIVGQLFINSLQLVIVPMVFTSITLAMCNISDTKKLGRISYKTILGFLAASIFALILAGIFGITAHKMGLFNVSINNITSSEGTAGSNPLLVFVQAIPNNIGSVFSENGRVLSIVFLASVTGICINTLGEQILVLKNILQDINKIITIFLTFVITKAKPIEFLEDSNRMYQAMGSFTILPQLLASLGVLFTVAGVGDKISSIISGVIPQGNILIGVIAYCVGMALFTAIMGNAFAAFSVITVGVGIPFVFAQGGDPVVCSMLALTAGYGGTFLTPMAANFNVLPAALLELKDKNAVIKAQAPLALILLVVHIILMYTLGF